MDKNKGVKQSLRSSYEMVRASWKYVAAYVLVEIILNMITNIAGRIQIVGIVVNAVIFFGYFCLPALVYKKISQN
jgi:hypothetical protein